METIELVYQAVNVCPLCGSSGRSQGQLTRQNYFFGDFIIPLPREGIYLCECTNCSLLFKSMVPKPDDLTEIMSREATGVWKSKTGTHPALSRIRPYLKIGSTSVLDIGASNGDLLAQLKPFVRSTSALDVVEYPQCRLTVNKEYIIGKIESSFSWSGDCYDIVTAFDIFEHFLDTPSALSNISAMVKFGGKLIVETGDWKSFNGKLDQWYYANLFEHQLFWDKESFDFLCNKYGFSLIQYENCNHKGRRNLGHVKKMAIDLVTKMAPNSSFQQAMLATRMGDPLRFARSSLVDHVFVVMEKTFA